MSDNAIAESNTQSIFKRLSVDVFSKPITLLNEQTQKTLSQMTIPKVLVLYTGTHLDKLLDRFQK